MRWFGKKKEELPKFSPEEYEPVLRCSICTGEQVACVRHRTSGQLRELMLIRDREDLESFCRSYGSSPETIRRIY